MTVHLHVRLFRVVSMKTFLRPLLLCTSAVVLFTGTARPSEFDNAVGKIKMMAAHKAGEPSPFELGRETVDRYFKVTDECAQVARLKLLQARSK